MSLTTQKWPWNDNGKIIRKEATTMQAKYHSDKCTLPNEEECTRKFILAEETKKFFNEANSNTCHQMIGDQFSIFWNKLDSFSPPLDINQLPYEVQKGLVGVAEDFGWHL